MKYSEIRELTTQEIMDLVEEEKANLVKMRLNHAISPLDNPNKIKETKKTIARLKTELSSRKNTEGNK